MTCFVICQYSNCILGHRWRPFYRNGLQQATVLTYGFSPSLELRCNEVPPKYVLARMSSQSTVVSWSGGLVDPLSSFQVHFPAILQSAAQRHRSSVLLTFIARRSRSLFSVSTARRQIFHFHSKNKRLFLKADGHLKLLLLGVFFVRRSTVSVCLPVTWGDHQASDK